MGKIQKIKRHLYNIKSVGLWENFGASKCWKEHLEMIEVVFVSFCEMVSGVNSFGGTFSLGRNLHKKTNGI